MKGWLKTYWVPLILVGLLGVGLFVGLTYFCPNCLTSNQSQMTQTPLKGSDSNSPLSLGSPAPDFVLENLKGEKISLTDFKDSNVLLVFWASTCGWCEKERPDLNRFAVEQKGNIEVLAVSWEPKETLKKYIEKKEVKFTLLSDSSGEAQVKYFTFGTPNHFLINKERKIAVTRPGYASYNDLLMFAQAVKK